MLGIPRRLNELWPWFNAVCSWDWGDPIPLSELIRSEPIPEEFRTAVGDIVEGTRKRKRNYVKSKIPAAERLKIAGSISIVIDLCNTLKTGAAEGIQSMASRLNVEPIDVIRKLEAEARKTQKDAAKQLGVSVETIENLIRDMRARIARWPVV